MAIYFVISEEVKTHSGGEYEPPEYGHICEIVQAQSNSHARFLAWRNSRDGRNGGDLMDMPRFVTRKLADEEGTPRVLDHAEADPWWARVPDGVHAPGARGEEIAR